MLEKEVNIQLGNEIMKNSKNDLLLFSGNDILETR